MSWRKSLLFLLALGGPVLAQSQNDLLNAVYAAQSTIAVTTPFLEQESLAKALHYAITRRGVKVFIVHEFATANAPGAYTGSLSLLGAGIRLLRNVPSPTRVLVDSKILIEWQGGAMGGPVKGTKDPQAIRRFVQEFNSAYLKGTDYAYQPKLPPGYTELEKHPINDLIEMTDKSASWYARFVLGLKRINRNGSR